MKVLPVLNAEKRRKRRKKQPGAPQAVPAETVILGAKDDAPDWLQVPKARPPKRKRQDAQRPLPAEAGPTTCDADEDTIPITDARSVGVEVAPWTQAKRAKAKSKLVDLEAPTDQQDAKTDRNFKAGEPCGGSAQGNACLRHKSSGFLQQVARRH